MKPLLSPFKATALALFIATTSVSSIALADTATKLNAQAKQYYANKEYSQAFNTYQQAANQGNAKSMAWVGYFYANGKGVPKDVPKAIEWYTKAADGGDSWAMDRLGDIYRKGIDVNKNEVVAAGWYQKAAAKGQADSMSWMYTFYRDGRGGLPKDEVKAIEWLKKAAEAGDDWAMDKLGDRYRKGKGVPQNYGKAMELYKKAVDAGNDDALFSIAWMYSNGQGVSQNHKKSVEWYKKAAEVGDAYAMNNLGVKYRDGEGVSQDYKTALEWFEKAIGADSTYANAYVSAGKMYENGRGTSINTSKAKEYYQKAIDIGDDPYALVVMGEFYSQINDVKALNYYKQAAEADLDIGMSKLATRYENGNGTKQNYNQAAHWYAKSLKATKKSSAYYNLKGGKESAKEYTLRKLENLLTTGKITDPTIRKQVQALFAKPPLITWQTTPPTTITNESLTLSVRLTDQGEGIGDVRLLLDGVAVDQSTRGLGRDINQTTRTFNLTVPKGKHTLTVQAYPKHNAGYSNDIEHTITSTYQPVQKPKIHAVVVGIDNYQDPSLNLKYATTDANAMYQALLKQTGGIYEKGQLTLLNTKANTTKRSIETALENITKTAQMNDVFVFYAASHGYNYPSLGYYLFTSEVSGTSDNAIKRTGLSADDLQDLLAQVKTNKKLILLDSCASGDAINARDLVVSNRGLGDQMAADVMKAKSGAMVMMASSSQQQAIEGYQGHGLFTYSVLQGLKGKADMNKDGWTQTGELKMFVEDDVQALSKRLFNQVQNPKASSDGDAFGFKVF